MLVSRGLVIFSAVIIALSAIFFAARSLHHPTPSKGAAPSQQLSIAYPIKVSASRRFFVDQNNVPVLIIGDAPQSLGTMLDPTWQDIYFSDREAKGFNAAWINLLCARGTAGTDDGRTATGVAPFTSGSNPSTYDLSTPNNTYFELFDATINLAASYGINVFLDPIETISWLVTLQNNGNAKAFDYGVYVGNRYKDFPNIVWLHGNDFRDYTDSTSNNLVGQVMAGIASVDTNHIQTINLLTANMKVDSDNYSNQDTELSSYFGANLTYTYSATANVTLRAYNSSPTIPVFLGETGYEFENNVRYPGGVTGTYRLRAEVYGSLTWGGIGGYLYGNRYSWRSLWTKDQAGRLDTPGAAQIAHINTLMNQVGEWWNLEPDQTHSVVTAGYGSVPAPNTDPTLADYCTTSANGTTSLTYCPNHTTLTVAMSNFNGSVTARWYDPSNGTFLPISGSPFTNAGSRDFTMPGNNADGDPDWLLLLTACNNQMSTNSAFFPVNGGEGSFNLTTGFGCSWEAISNASWIEISSEATGGGGNATINYIVRDNLSPVPRQGSIAIAGLTFTVTQDSETAPDCIYNIFPSFQSHPAAGGSGSINIVTDERCAWQAASSANWITVTSGCCGIASGSITYSVAANPSSSGRAATITIGNRSFKVKQKGG